MRRSFSVHSAPPLISIVFITACVRSLIVDVCVLALVPSGHLIYAELWRLSSIVLLDCLLLHARHSRDLGAMVAHSWGAYDRSWGTGGGGAFKVVSKQQRRWTVFAAVAGDRTVFGVLLYETKHYSKHIKSSSITVGFLKSHFFLFYLCTVTLFVCLSTHCQPLSSPHLSVFTSPAPSQSPLSPLSDCFLLFVLAVSTSFFIYDFLLSLSSLSLSGPLSARLSFPFLLLIILRRNVPSLSLFFLRFLALSPSPSRQPQQVYFSGLLSVSSPWRRIIEQADPWLHSCCLGGVWLSFLCVFLNNYGVSVFLSLASLCCLCC